MYIVAVIVPIIYFIISGLSHIKTAYINAIMFAIRYVIKSSRLIPDVFLDFIVFSI